MLKYVLCTYFVCALNVDVSNSLLLKLVLVLVATFSLVHYVHYRN